MCYLDNKIAKVFLGVITLRSILKIFSPKYLMFNLLCSLDKVSRYTASGKEVMLSSYFSHHASWRKTEDFHYAGYLILFIFPRKKWRAYDREQKRNNYKYLQLRLLFLNALRIHISMLKTVNRHSLFHLYLRWSLRMLSFLPFLCDLTCNHPTCFL